MEEYRRKSARSAAELQVQFYRLAERLHYAFVDGFARSTPPVLGAGKLRRTTMALVYWNIFYGVSPNHKVHYVILRRFCELFYHVLAQNEDALGRQLQRVRAEWNPTRSRPSDLFIKGVLSHLISYERLQAVFPGVFTTEASGPSMWNKRAIFPSASFPTTVGGTIAISGIAQPVIVAGGIDVTGRPEAVRVRVMNTVSVQGGAAGTRPVNVAGEVSLEGASIDEAGALLTRIEGASIDEETGALLTSIEGASIDEDGALLTRTEETRAPATGRFSTIAIDGMEFDKTDQAAFNYATAFGGLTVFQALNELVDDGQLFADTIETSVDDVLAYIMEAIYNRSVTPILPREFDKWSKALQHLQSSIWNCNEDLDQQVNTVKQLMKELLTTVVRKYDTTAQVTARSVRFGYGAVCDEDWGDPALQPRCFRQLLTQPEIISTKVPEFEAVFKEFFDALELYVLLFKAIFHGSSVYSTFFDPTDPARVMQQTTADITSKIWPRPEPDALHRIDLGVFVSIREELFRKAQKLGVFFDDLLETR